MNAKKFFKKHPSLRGYVSGDDDCPHLSSDGKELINYPSVHVADIYLTQTDNQRIRESIAQLGCDCNGSNVFPCGACCIKKELELEK